jgi:hypothetical protein
MQDLHPDKKQYRKESERDAAAGILSPYLFQDGDYSVFGSVLCAETKGCYEGIARRPRDSATLPRGLSMVQICVPCVVMHEAMS